MEAPGPPDPDPPNLKIKPESTGQGGPKKRNRRKERTPRSEKELRAAAERGESSSASASASGSNAPPSINDSNDKGNTTNARTAAAGSGRGGGGGRPPTVGRRNVRFNAGLTSNTTASAANVSEGGASTDAESQRPPTSSSKPPRGQGQGGRGGPRRNLPSADATDLTSLLIRGLSVSPFTECLICFNPIRPEQPIWSCSPSIPLLPKDDTANGENESPQYCWSTFHLKCIRAWAEKSYNDVKEAWRARGEMDKGGEWRCPGCQGRRGDIGITYRCFCSLIPSPSNPSKLFTPHSCGQSCTRPRSHLNPTTSCTHPCTMLCHPGPCPPCKVILTVTCGCPRAKKRNVKCAEVGGRVEDVGAVSCGEICGRQLGCGDPRHTCKKTCHAGECEPCDEVERAVCYCGRETKEGRCGTLRTPWIGKIGCGDDVDQLEPKDGELVMGWSCKNACGSAYDCGHHNCQRECHPRPKPNPSSAASASAPPCPFSPEKIKTCPCGRTPILSTGTSTSSSQLTSNAFSARTSCTDPIPTCSFPCQKPLEGCDHFCQETCHVGECPPCKEKVVKPCRCGSTTKALVCGDIRRRKDAVDVREIGESGEGEDDGVDANGEVLCERQCGALLSCGRHRCSRHCCPLYPLTSGMAKGKSKKRSATDDPLAGISPHLAQLHTCSLLCNKPLSCGNPEHKCLERDHRGPCPPCLQSSFEDVSCACGRTVLEPPVACGTVVECPYPCSLEPSIRECGHPRSGGGPTTAGGGAAAVGAGGSHRCHEGGVEACPPCVYLTDKLCACGKKVVRNVRCGLGRERVGCGSVCGKLLGCGFHKCQRICHADECGPCTMACGKMKRLCAPLHHPCTHPCHAPSSCPENTPCESQISLSCSCGRITINVPCTKSVQAPLGRSETQLNQVRPKCTAECGVLKRNARLADALGIRVDGEGKRLSSASSSSASSLSGEGAIERGKELYSDELVNFARREGGTKAVGEIERIFGDFVTSAKRTQVLAHMPVERRGFVIGLASVYRMDTQLVDQEPYRSVQLLRRIDTRIPPVLLSQYITSLNAQSQTAAQPNLGRLGLSTSGVSGGAWRSGAGAGGAKPVAAAGGNAWGIKPAATAGAGAGAGAGGGSVWGARTAAAVVAGRSGSPVPARGHSPTPVIVHQPTAAVTASAWGGPSATTPQNQTQTLSGVVGTRPASSSPAPAAPGASSASGGNAGSTMPTAAAVHVGGQTAGNVNTGEGEEDIPDSWEDDD